MNAVTISLRNLFLMTLLLGGIYPLTITLVSNMLFPIRSQGSLIKLDDRVVGSELIAQKFSRDNYFWPRPSAVDYNSASSGASQKSVTSEELKKAVLERQAKMGTGAPADMLYASGSGLDPHISLEAANFQSPRVLKARNLGQEKLNQLILAATEDRFLGFMGQPRVNVLKLNLLLDKNK